MHVLSSSNIDKEIELLHRIKQVCSNIEYLQQLAVDAANDQLNVVMQVQVFNKTKYDAMPACKCDSGNEVRNQAYQTGCLAVFLPQLSADVTSNVIHERKRMMQATQIFSYPLREQTLLRMLDVMLRDLKKEHKDLLQQLSLIQNNRYEKE